MTPRIERLREYTVGKLQADGWKEIDWSKSPELVFTPDDSHIQRALRCFLAVLKEEEKNVRFIPEEQIVFTRTVKNLPQRYTTVEMNALRSQAYYHELGVVFNLTVDYESVLICGLDALREQTVSRLKQAVSENDSEGIEFLEAVIMGIDGVCSLADSYCLEAERLGLSDIAKRLKQVPHKQRFK